MSSSNNATSNRSSSVARPTSLPQRPVTIIMTNNMEILRQTRQMHQQRLRQTTTTATAAVDNNDHTTENLDHQHEHFLQEVLDLELRQAARNYVSRTHQSNPIHYVVRLRDSDLGLD